ncbi:Type-1 restriction enzyme EcoKI specificity protein [Symmachiella dynata]|uniref:Type-1 restriction enzyme EcoKI specificity protein n=1 Tax=Symmachiella dynata TaxID=2527995 RepID=A0A517ZPC8_9PLAN|nr:restriction endonuclease subunit S [Symmachiella dynata]QDU44301.1 Type-1 restriction enzyme EcoKI specificity protein [Symmachiella dynata]
MSGTKGLPKGWVWAQLDEVANVNPPKSSPNVTADELFNFVPMRAVIEEFGGIDVSMTRPFSEVQRGYTQFQTGDILSAKITPCMENGKIAVVPPLRQSVAYGSTEFHVLRPHNGIEPRWIAHYLFQSNFRRNAQRNMSGSAGQLRVPKPWLKLQRIPVAPPNEQRRIVAKLEELFSDLDAGVAALERARANLKRYRAAVLKAAVEGKLTAAWREQQPDVEPASELLKRILVERRQKWEADQLAKYEAKGKKPPKGWKAKYKEPAAPDTAGLPELPDGWCWVTLPQVGLIDRGRSRNRPRNAKHLYGGPYPFIQTGEVRRSNTFIKEFEKTYSESGLAQSRLWPKGTLCITIAANIAETAILDFDGCFPDSVVGFVGDANQVSVRYLEIYLRTMQKRLEILAPATAQKNLNLETLNAVAVAFPPLKEQFQIVEEVDLRLSIVDSIESEVDKHLVRSSRLRQSVLKRAFQGNLVRQDTADKPAAAFVGQG